MVATYPDLWVRIEQARTEKERVAVIRNFILNLKLPEVTRQTIPLGDILSLSVPERFVPFAVGYKYVRVDYRFPIPGSDVYVLGIADNERKLLLLNKEGEMFWNKRIYYIHFIETYEKNFKK